MTGEGSRERGPYSTAGLLGRLSVYHIDPIVRHRALCTVQLLSTVDCGYLMSMWDALRQNEVRNAGCE